MCHYGRTHCPESWRRCSCDAPCVLHPTATLTSQVFTEPDGTQHRLEDTAFTVAPEAGAMKCAAPTITYNKGRLHFACATPGARFVSTVNVGQPHVDGYEGDNIELPTSLVVTVYAKADGYSDSDLTTATLTFSDSGLKAERLTIEATKDNTGDVNRDNTVDVTDILAIISIMAGK
ncbi:MAG: hypothetical protein K6D91_03525 [Prevotella sp.]|nr:hypothetical protein [Prevotella sp.]